MANRRRTILPQFGNSRNNSHSSRWKAQDLGKHSLARVEKLTKQLIREGLIVPKPTGYGLQVSLNPRQNEAIIAIMKRFFPESSLPLGCFSSQSWIFDLHYYGRAVLSICRTLCGMRRAMIAIHLCDLRQMLIGRVDAKS